jgi:hypothetical protein
MARATFDRCGLVLGGGATLPEAPGRVRIGRWGCAVF